MDHPVLRLIKLIEGTAPSLSSHYLTSRCSIPTEPSKAASPPPPKPKPKPVDIGPQFHPAVLKSKVFKEKTKREATEDRGREASRKRPSREEQSSRLVTAACW